MEKDSKGQSIYRAKTRTVQELEYLNNYKVIADQLIEWKKAKPDSEVLKVLGQALAHIGIYVASMEMEQDSFEKIVSQYRKDKLKYQRQALEAVTNLEKYEREYFKGE